MDCFVIDDHDFSSSFASHEESSVISSNSYDQTMFQDEFLDLQNLCDEYHISSSMEGLETIPSAEFMKICEWINETEDGNYRPASGDQELSSCVSFESDENSVVGMSMILPGMESESDEELLLHYLLRAYAEATENGDKDLADVLVKSTNEKSSAMGSTMERVAFSLFQFKEKHSEYLILESIKNSIEAFMALYQGLPTGRFAHLTANSAIIEAMPSDAAEVHVIDFDTGEGIQWAALMESLSWKNKSLKLTSVKLGGECTSFGDFEETKKRLLGHAKQYNCKLRIEEKNMEDVVNELTRMKKRGVERKWLVFNCMVGLPHMARRRPRSQVLEFLKVAKELVSKFAGILTLGDGEEGYGFNTCSSYHAFFDKLLRHYHALFESLEKSFPSYLAAARTTVEGLFFAPFMSPFDWFQDWEEMMKRNDVQEGMGLEGRELSKKSLAEVKEMVNEREGPFKVKIEGYREHEMVLEWKDTPLVRVSTWM
ncbi:protein NODULATION SIGNALING PATHWAY 2-like [Primulina eburnea]|uniref:protein NODULATION SIGNALING PATHWAY 2-like n=1 Tax=Primulina eburnea TaxID=1245227 RepID=UPI003C6C8B3D